MVKGRMAKEDGMNAELIDLYKAVQGRRGEWQDLENEDVYHPNYGRGVMSDPNHGFELEVWFERGGWAYLPMDDPDLLWLPPVWSDDGRCLWAWVDWERWDLWVHEGGVCSMFRKDEWGEWDVSDYDYKNPVVQEATLPEALLRAIAEQEGDHE